MLTLRALLLMDGLSCDEVPLVEGSRSLGKDEIVADVHKASNTLEEVRRRRPTNKHSPIVLLLLPAIVEGIVHDTC